MSEPNDQLETLAQSAKRNVLWLLGIPSIGLLLSFLTFAPLSKTTISQTVGWVGALGLQLTAWGLIVSIIGFAFTLWQLHRTQGASAAAAKALIRIKRDYSSFDLVTEIRTARAYGEVAISHISDSRWTDALASTNNLRASLNKISAVTNGLTEEQRESTRDYILFSLDACQALENQKLNHAQSFRSEDINASLRELDGFLITTEYSLRDAIRGPE